jgi:hypothetical protein
MRWAGHVTHMRKSSYRVFWGEKNWRKQTTRKKYSTWEDNIKLDISEIERKVVDWLHPARLLYHDNVLFLIVVPCILVTSKFFSPTNAPFY